MEVEPSVATVPPRFALCRCSRPPQKQLIAVTAARIFTKSFLNVVFFHVRYLLLSFIFFVVVSLYDAYNDKSSNVKLKKTGHVK